VEVLDRKEAETKKIKMKERRPF